MSEESHEKSAEEYESMRKMVMQQKSVQKISDEDLPYFISYMNQYKMDLLDKEDYLGAKDAAAILDVCRSEEGNRQKMIKDPEESKPTTNSLEKRKMEVDKKIEAFDADTAKKQETIRANHAKEMEDFENKWRDEMPERYRRVSKKLVDLRETAKTLAMAGHYDEAAARKNEADNLEAEEYKEAQNRLKRDYRIAKGKLIRKQEGELRKFNEARADKRDLYNAEIHALEENEKNREFVLKSKPTSIKRKSRMEIKHAIMTRSLRKSQGFKESKLPPLRPPNEKETKSHSAGSTMHKNASPEKKEEVPEKAPEKNPEPETKKEESVEAVPSGETPNQ